MGNKKRVRLDKDAKRCQQCGNITGDTVYFTSEQCAKILEISATSFLALIKEYLPSARPYRVRPSEVLWSRFDFDCLIRVMSMTQMLADAAKSRPEKMLLSIKLPVDFVLPAKLEPVRDLLTLEYHGPAIYFLFLKSEAVYVGQSIEPMKRLKQHAAGDVDGERKQFDAHLIYPVILDELLQAERTFIAILDPPINKSLKEKARDAIAASRSLELNRGLGSSFTRQPLEAILAACPEIGLEYIGAPD